MNLIRMCTEFSQCPQWDEKSFLQEGFFLRWDDEWDLVAWGTSCRESMPRVDEISCYIPDFYMEDPQPWCVFEQGGLFKRGWLERSFGKGFEGFEENPLCGRRRGVVGGDFLSHPMNLQKARVGSEDFSRVWEEPRLEDFSRVFDGIQSRIRIGELNKAVPVVFAQSEGEFSEWERKRALVFGGEPSYEWPQHYGWWGREEGILGCTPELLFVYEPNEKKLKRWL